MRICYLILADVKPQQLARLIARLDQADSAFVVHVDARRDLTGFSDRVEPTRGELHFVDRRELVRPGGFATTQATINALELAVAEAPSDYYVLLSELDYPIRTDQQLRDELAANAIHADVRPIQSTRPEMLERLEYRYVATRKENGLASRLLNELILSGLPKRDVATALGGRPAYIGSPWWALPGDEARAVLAFFDREKRLMQLFRTSRHPEEMLFQTAIAALPRGRQIRPPLTFVHTARAAAQGRADALLDSNDLTLLENSGRYFARVFDADRDPKVLDLIDSTLLGDPYEV